MAGIALLAMLSVTGQAASAGKHERIHFRIPQQRADQALIEFAEQADVTFMFPFEVSQNKTTNALVGSYTAPEAIAILLRGTGLKAEFSVDGALTVSSETPPRAGHNDNAGDGTMNTNTKDRLSLLARFAGAVGSIFSLDGAAQSLDAQPLEIETVVVTARFREEDAQDIGISIAAYGQRQIERAGLVEVQDISLRTPGMVVLDSGPNSNDINIRGVTNSVPGGSGGLRSLVTVYLDDVVVSGMGSGSATDFNMFDLNRVEVLRGPQPTYFGEGSVGGTVRYFSEDPRLAPGVEGALSAGTRSTESGSGLSYRVDNATSFSLVPDVLGVKLVGFHEDDAGFIDAPYLNRKDLNGYENNGGRAVVLYQPNDRFSARLAGHMAKLTQNASNGIDPAQDLRPIRTASLRNGAVALGEGSDEYQVFSAKLAYKFDRLTLESITGHTNFEVTSQGEEPRNTQGFRLFLQSFGVTGIDTTVMNVFESEDTTFTQEFRLMTDLGGPVDFTAGAYYKDSTLDRIDALRSAAMEQFMQPGNDLLKDQVLSTTTEQLSGFAEATVRLTDKARLIAGARYVHEDLTSTLESSLSFRLTGIGGNGRPIFGIRDDRQALAGFGLGSSFDFDLREYLYRVGFEYDLTDEVLLYANASRGLRNGGLNAILSAATLASDPDTGEFDNAVFLDSLIFREDTVNGVELGAKTRWLDGTLTVNGAVYYTDYQDPQVLTGVPFRQVSNAPDIDIYGMELETALAVNDHWSVYLNGAYLDSEFTGNQKLMSIPGAPEDFQDLRRGNRPNNSPKLTVSTGAGFNYPIGAGELSLIGDTSFSYVGKRYGSVQNFPTTLLGSMQIWNFRLGVQNERWSVAAYVNNILNDLELQSTFTPSNGAFLNEANVLDAQLSGASVNRPRTIGVNVRINY